MSKQKSPFGLFCLFIAKLRWQDSNLRPIPYTLFSCFHEAWTISLPTFTSLGISVSSLYGVLKDFEVPSVLAQSFDLSVHRYPEKFISEFLLRAAYLTGNRSTAELHRSLTINFYARSFLKSPETQPIIFRFKFVSETVILKTP